MMFLFLKCAIICVVIHMADFRIEIIDGVIVIYNLKMEEYAKNGATINELTMYDSYGNRFACNCRYADAPSYIKHYEELGYEAFVGLKGPIVMNGKAMHNTSNDSVGIYIAGPIKTKKFN